MSPVPTLNKIERRVLGVLVEKAKTVPDSYPLSLHGLVTGCNQKSNRDPFMQLDESTVEDALESLRMRGAVAEIQGSGRVPKYRHHMKDFLGIDGTELAVLTELLLRGAQTVGDLRIRAARMAANQLNDLQALRPVLDSLIQKGLVLELTPPGRGQIVSHAFYLPEELEKVKRELRAASARETTWEAGEVGRDGTSSGAESLATRSGAHLAGEMETLKREVGELREQIRQLTEEFHQFRQLFS